MRRLIERTLPSRYAPRWIVAALDGGLAGVALLGALLLRFEFAVPEVEWDVWWRFLAIFFVVRLGVARGFELESGILRHTGTEDARRVFWAVSLGTVAFAGLNGLRFVAFDGQTCTRPRRNCRNAGRGLH